MHKTMKRLFIAILAAIALAGCDKKDTSSTDTTKDAINQQKDAVDAAAKDAKKQVDANADAAKAQLDADKKKIEAQSRALTNK